MPTDFLGFGLGTDVRVVEPVEVDLPARNRIIDGGYLVEREGQREIVPRRGGRI